MTLAPRLLLLALVAAAPPPAGWFVPPPNPPNTDTMNLDARGEVVETVTVTASRHAHPFRGEESEHANDPRRNDIIRPEASFSTERPYCNATLRTVAGQPASEADMVTGPANGSC